MRSDDQLLADYVTGRSEGAFAEIYRRHAGWVLAVARRQVTNEELAKDVTQAVFLLLAQRASKIRSGTALGAWLFTSTRLTSKAALRVEARRKRREREVGMTQRTFNESDSIWPQLAGSLDELVDKLRPTDRDAILLRFYQQKTHEQVGMAMGTSSEAARKRVDRALTQLQGLFARRGVVLSTAGIGDALVRTGGESGSTGAASTALVGELLRNGAIGGTRRAGQIVSSVKLALLTTKIAATLAAVAIIGGSIGAGTKLMGGTSSRTSSATVAHSAPAARPASPVVAVAAVPVPSIDAPGTKPDVPPVLRTQPVASPAVNQDEIHIKGIVLDPQGKPVAGAKVRAPNPIQSGFLAGTSSGGDGRFEFAYRKSQASSWAVGELPAEYRWKEVKVAAAAEGFGLIWKGWDQVDEKGDLVLQLVADNAPIEGRIVDASGKPAAGAKISIFQIQNWIDGGGESVPESFKKDMRGRILWGAAPLLGLPDEILTEAMGRFTIKGLGSDRKIYLGVTGPTVAATELEVITRYVPTSKRYMDDLSMAEKREFTVFGAKFEYQAHAAQSVVGAVRDAKTHQPVAGVRVQESQRGIIQWVIHGKQRIESVTDAQGHYRLDAFPAVKGNEILAIPRDDQPYLMRGMKVPVSKDGQPVTLDMELHRGVWITGKVTEKGSNAPIAGRMEYSPFLSNSFSQALPEFHQKQRTMDWEITRWSTKADGTYRMVGIPGRAIVAIWSMSDRYRTGQGADVIKSENWMKNGPDTYHPFNIGDGMTVVKEIDVPPNAQEYRVDLEVDPGQTLAATVVDDEGKPCPGCSYSGNTPQPFMVWKEQDESQQNPATFDIIGLSEREERLVTVSNAPRKLGKISRVSLATASDGKVTIKLDKLTSVTGRLLDEEGKALAGVAIETTLGKGTPDYLAAKTDNQGRFTCTLIPGGEYSIGARSSALANRVETVSAKLNPKPAEQIHLGDLKFNREKDMSAKP